MNLLINSIYFATEGEGIHIGTPQVFVRFQGCNIGCVNCDSKETWEFDESFGTPISKVIEGVKKYPVKRVSITGGDPLHPKHLPGVIELAKLLKGNGYYVNIEASGMRIIDELFDIIDFISFDFKTPSTGVSTSLKLLHRLAEQYPKKFQIKSVIETKEDLAASNKAREELSRKYDDIIWCLTPAYTPGVDFSLEMFRWILDQNQSLGAPFRVIGQQHKWIFGPDRKQV